MQAISHAEMILGWYENLPKHEVPPEWMWPFPDELESWFERIEEERKEGRTGPDKGDDRFSGGARNDLVRQLKEAERDRPRQPRAS